MQTRQAADPKRRDRHPVIPSDDRASASVDDADRYRREMTRFLHEFVACGLLTVLTVALPA